MSDDPAIAADPDPPAALPATARPLLGIGLVVAATLAFALSDMLMKDLSARHPVPLVIAARYILNLAILLLIFAPRYGAALWRTDRTWLVLVRAVVLALASLTMGYALQRMPLGETVAIIYLAPFVVMLLAVPLLGERVGAAGWTAAGIGFAGVLLIMRPGGGLDPLGVVFALTNVGLGAAYHLLTRFLARTESTHAMLFHVALVGTIFFCLASIGSLEGGMPDRRDLALMLLLGGFATLGHFLFTAAYREAPASLLAPVTFTHLVWAGGLGFAVFGHRPDPASILGMALVCVAGVGIAWRARKRI